MQDEYTLASVSHSPHTAAAAQQLANLYPDIAVDIGPDAVELRATGRTDQELATIWKCAIVNERLHAANAAPRRALLNELFR